MNRARKIITLFRIEPFGVAMPGIRLEDRVRTIIERRAFTKISRARITGLVGACLALSATLLIATLTRAQVDATEDWKKSAGGKLSFEVASIKPNDSGPESPSFSNFMPGLLTGRQRPPEGILSATNYQIGPFIGFAYKLDSHEELALREELPKWASQREFDLEARPPASKPTWDQVRLMMQSLLADRLKLATHVITKPGPVYQLVLAKTGKLGPQMQRYPDGFPCSDYVRPAANSVSGRGGGSSIIPTVDDGRFPAYCGLISLARADSRSSGPPSLRDGGRDVSMESIVEWISTLGNLDRPLVDRTGLSGTFDVNVTFVPSATPEPPGADASNTIFLDAVSDQLGLKLKSATASVSSLVIDHIEEPTPN